MFQKYIVDYLIKIDFRFRTQQIKLHFLMFDQSINSVFRSFCFSLLMEYSFDFVSSSHHQPIAVHCWT